MLGSWLLRNLLESLANLKSGQTLLDFLDYQKDWIRRELLGGAASEQQLSASDFRVETGEEGALG